MKRLEIRNTKNIKGIEHTTVQTYYIKDIFNGEHSLVVRKNSKVIEDGQERELQDATFTWSDAEGWDAQIADLSRKLEKLAEIRQADEDEDPIGDIITLTDEDDLPDPDGDQESEQDILKKFDAPEGARLVKVFKNGNIQIRRTATCDRCGNRHGIYFTGVCNGVPVPSHVDNGVCFKCLGSGVMTVKEILMTPENQKKHDQQIQKKQEAWEAEQARIKAEQEAEEARLQAEKEAKEAELKAKKAISQHVGQVGERLDLTLTLVHSHSFEVPAFKGWGTDIMHIHILKDEAGNTFTWKTTSSINIPVGNYDFKVAEHGDKVILKGTVKEHSEYKDEKQTVLTRCKIIDIKEGGVR